MMYLDYNSRPNSEYVIGQSRVVAHSAGRLDNERLDERLTELFEQGHGENVSPMALEENYHKSDADLFRTALPDADAMAPEISGGVDGYPLNDTLRTKKGPRDRTNLYQQ